MQRSENDTSKEIRQAVAEVSTPIGNLDVAVSGDTRAMNWKARATRALPDSVPMYWVRSRHTTPEDSSRQETVMAENTQLLVQRVGKHQDKLKEAAAVVTMTQHRHADAAKSHKETERALRTLESALVKTEKKAKRLKKQAKDARRLASAADSDRRDARAELSTHTKAHEKRQKKLAKFEAALAAAQASEKVQQTTSTDKAIASATPRDDRKGTSKTTKKSATTRKRTTAAKSTATTKTAATKKAAPTRKRAATTKASSSTGNTTRARASKRSTATKRSTRKSS